jgi:hypothetical protein
MWLGRRCHGRRVTVLVASLSGVLMILLTSCYARWVFVA